MLPRPARSATRTATPWPNPSTARTGPSSSGGASHSLTWPSWNWRRSGGSRGGTRSAFTRRWATGHRNRSKPSIMQAKRHKPSHYKKGNKNQATSLVWMSPVGQYHQKPKNSCRIIHPPPQENIRRPILPDIIHRSNQRSTLQFVFKHLNTKQPTTP